MAERYTGRFEALAPDLPGAGLPWLADARAKAWQEFLSAGLPTQRQEAWRYTSLRGLKAAGFAAASPLANGIAAAEVPGLLSEPAARLVFVNGFWRPDLSTAFAPDGQVRFGSLAGFLQDDPAVLEPLLAADDAQDLPLATLNGALMQDGYVLLLGRRTIVERPIELTFIHLGSEAVEYHGRHLVLADEGAQATIVEQHIDLGSGAYFANHVTRLIARQGARLTRTKLQREGNEAFHVATTHIDVARDASVSNYELSLGAAMSRNEIRVALTGPGGELRLDGAYLLRGSQHGDVTTWIDHRAGETSSSETYKGVLDDTARGVFQGRITVRPDAQKISGHQLNKTLLLSDKAEIDTKPELEIFADDVKCSHGATAGELDETALFYLRSRGVPEDEARGLLIAAFVEDTLSNVQGDELKAALQQAIEGWLAEAAGVQA